MKVFDTVNHDMLMGKLNKIGIRCIANELIRNYEQNANSKNGVASSPINITCGVQQGSKLGSLHQKLTNITRGVKGVKKVLLGAL